MTNRDIQVGTAVQGDPTSVLQLLQTQQGPFVGNPRLWQFLGYTSVDAFRKAAERGTLPIPTFTLPHRRGRFAHVEDVVAWLRRVGREAAGDPPSASEPEASHTVETT
jgi:hypothetical protein